MSGIQKPHASFSSRINPCGTYTFFLSFNSWRAAMLELVVKGVFLKNPCRRTRSWRVRRIRHCRSVSESNCFFFPCESLSSESQFFFVFVFNSVLIQLPLFFVQIWLLARVARSFNFFPTLPHVLKASLKSWCLRRSAWISKCLYFYLANLVTMSLDQCSYNDQYSQQKQNPNAWPSVSNNMKSHRTANQHVPWNNGHILHLESILSACFY